MTNSNNKFIENPQSVEDFLNFAGFQLSKFPNPKIESEMLLSFALEKERVWLKTHSNYILTENESAKSREIIEKLVMERMIARENKDWAESDRIRDLLSAEYNVEILDSAVETTWRVK